MVKLGKNYEGLRRSNLKITARRANLTRLMHKIELNCTTYGISCGNTSASILIDSVLGLAVGAAARRIFNMAICKGSNTFVTLSL